MPSGRLGPEQDRLPREFATNGPMKVCVMLENVVFPTRGVVTPPPDAATLNEESATAAPASFGM